MNRLYENKTSFFSHDRNFYRMFFSLTGLMLLQNMITCSVNVADTVMLGSWSQSALSGAAAVNQIQFILQSFTISGLGEGLIVLGSQYWGKRSSKAVEQLTGIALISGLIGGSLLTLWTFAAPMSLLHLFTNDPDVLSQAMTYLSIMRWTWLLFIVINILLMALRTVEIVGIASRLSILTLVMNVVLDYILIFGRMGAPALGVKGSAIATLAAYLAELTILIFYCISPGHSPIRFGFSALFGRINRQMVCDFLRVCLPCVVSALLFSSSVAVQTAVLGHLSSDALAANSAASTLFQYMKMVPVSAASASCVIIGQTVGRNDTTQLRSLSHTLQLIYVIIGLITCSVILLLRPVYLNLYSMTPQAAAFTWQILTILAFTGIGTAYEMPCQCGIIRGGGETAYVMKSDFIYGWLVVVPLSLAAAYLWHWPLWAVVMCLNCDQIFKCVTVGFKTNGYSWVHRLIRREEIQNS